MSQATLISLLSQHSVPLVDCGIAVDEPDSLLERLRTCLDRGDVVVTTGGVSMGDRDILRKVGGFDFKRESLLMLPQVKISVFLLGSRRRPRSGGALCQGQHEAREADHLRDADV